MLWAAKEAAFKAVSKLKPGLSFTHRAYAVRSPPNEDTQSRPIADSPLLLTEENSLCSRSHRESAHWDEPGKPTPILLKKTNGDAVSIQERGVVMTPVGPVDTFFTLSSHRVHCVAAVRNGNGGAPAAAPVHVLEERREGLFDPSATVRRSAIHHLASVLKASPYYIDIRRDKTTHGYGAPRVFIEGGRTDIDISLSHDGQYIAFAVHY
jgi:phosphopantetheinyl transferase (holo-ACP synthase)